MYIYKLYENVNDGMKRSKYIFVKEKKMQNHLRRLKLTRKNKCSCIGEGNKKSVIKSKNWNRSEIVNIPKNINNLKFLINKSKQMGDKKKRNFEERFCNCCFVK